MESILISGNTAIIDRKVYSLASSSASLQPGAKQTTPLPPLNLYGFPWFPWGSNNLFPEDVLKAVSINTVASRALNFRIKTHYGLGLVAYRVTGYDEQGCEIREPIGKKSSDKEIQDFLKLNSMEKFQLQMITDFEYYKNFFPEMILSKNKKKIVLLNPLKAIWCRWGVMDPETRKISNAYISRNWPINGLYSDVSAVYDDQDPLKSYKFVYPCSIPSAFDDYYNLPEWDAARSSGWIEIANDVPRIKKAMFKNQMMLKYHIKVPSTYWRNAYKDWDQKTEAQQVDTKRSKLSELMDVLTGPENANKAFMSEKVVDDYGKEYPGWEILPLMDNNKDGAFLPDSQGANSEILFALGVDPSLIGAGIPGGKLGAGSGSDKLQAFNIHSATLKTDRDMTLIPIRFVHDFNGYDPEVLYDYQNVKIANATPGKGSPSAHGVQPSQTDQTQD